MKIISWNVNSLKKGIDTKLKQIILEKDPDIICFQETRCKTNIIEEIYSEHFEIYKYRYYNEGISGQAGVAIWSKLEPINVINEIPYLFQLKQGRFLAIEFDSLIVLNTYVPNTGREIAENYRNMWHNALINWIPEQLSKNFIWCGDLNVVREPILDTSHHKFRPTKGIIPAGLKSFEKEQLDEYLDLGLTDVFRHLNPELKSFTWFSNINSTVGWRLDYFLVNKIENVKSITHGPKLEKGISDHTWIMLKLS